MFDEISPTYDKANHAISLGLDRYWRNSVTKNLPNKNQIHLLDLATGTGDQLISIMESKESIIEALGIDLSKEMLAIARKKIEEKHYRYKVTLEIGDATSTSYENASYDCVTMSFGIRNVENVLSCLKEIFRLLKTGGRALILEASMPKNLFIKKFHLFYLRYLLPNIGAILSKNKKAYKYLNKTTETFPCGENFCSLLKEAGFEKIKMIPLTFGAVTLYIADKD